MLASTTDRVQLRSAYSAREVQEDFHQLSPARVAPSPQAQYPRLPLQLGLSSSPKKAFAAAAVGLKPREKEKESAGSGVYLGVLGRPRLKGRKSWAEETSEWGSLPRDLEEDLRVPPRWGAWKSPPASPPPSDTRIFSLEKRMCRGEHPAVCLRAVGGRLGPDRKSQRPFPLRGCAWCQASPGRRMADSKPVAQGSQGGGPVQTLLAWSPVPAPHEPHSFSPYSSTSTSVQWGHGP